MRTGLLFLLLLTSCSVSKPVIPVWLHQKLLQAERNPNSYLEVWQYDYRNERVYYFIPACCDRFTELFNAQGKLVCYPAGGITGQGDGRCRKFLTGRKNGELIWRPRGATVD
ncbi:MAG: hypothetical protein C0424_07685 [Sphingobacteriaceae bacterium]|nr:hypothetical protein [Sphingobacteriaceae bacterium]